jgi:hypothetical protein
MISNRKLCASNFSINMIKKLGFLKRILAIKLWIVKFCQFMVLMGAENLVALKQRPKIKIA